MTDLEQKINNLEERVSKLEQVIKVSVVSTATKNSKPLSVREFLSSKELDSDTQKTLAIAYFYEVRQGNGSFNTDDIKNGFRTAKLKLPSNINDRINQNIKSNYMMDADEKKDGKKAWVLTDTGEKEIENNIIHKKNE